MARIDTMNPFGVQTDLQEQYETFLGGGNVKGMATLRIFDLEIPCTHTEIVGDVVMGSGGISPKTFVERCEFRANLVGANKPAKGVYCTLKPNPDADPIELQLFHGGLEPGGLVYRFTLVDKNYLA